MARDIDETIRRFESFRATANPLERRQLLIWREMGEKQRKDARQKRRTMHLNSRVRKWKAAYDALRELGIKI